MGHAVVQGLRELGEQLRRHWKDAVGLALYLGWVYCAFFGCGLAEPDPASVGRPADWSLERLWMAAGAAQALGAVAGLALVTCLPAASSATTSRALYTSRRWPAPCLGR